jgi:hypothetical protein
MSDKKVGFGPMDLAQPCSAAGVVSRVAEKVGRKRVIVALLE